MVLTGLLNNTVICGTKVWSGSTILDHSFVPGVFETIATTRRCRIIVMQKAPGTRNWIWHTFSSETRREKAHVGERNDNHNKVTPRPWVRSRLKAKKFYLTSCQNSWLLRKSIYSWLGIKTVIQFCPAFTYTGKYDKAQSWYGSFFEPVNLVCLFSFSTSSFVALSFEILRKKFPLFVKVYDFEALFVKTNIFLASERN